MVIDKVTWLVISRSRERNLDRQLVFRFANAALVEGAEMLIFNPKESFKQLPQRSAPAVTSRSEIMVNPWHSSSNPHGTNSL